MKKNILILAAILSFGLYSSCDYLDVVPDDMAVLDHAFANRAEAERYLLTCFSYIPDMANQNANIAMCGADELWTNRKKENESLHVAQGQQGVNDPFVNYWEGKRGASVNLYRGLRDCNTFLAVLADKTRIPDLNQTDRARWICEVKFLKGYYHFLLFRMYGPIVIADVALPIDATPDEVRLHRQPVDSVVNYIARLYDESLQPELPTKITNPQDELGRITHAIVLSMKARLLVTAASDLFNGNPDYHGFTDKDGLLLFAQNFKGDEIYKAKWERAREACDVALNACIESGAREYVFSNPKNITVPETILEMTIRNSFADDEWEKNPEIIWGLSGRRVSGLQTEVMTRIDPKFPLNNASAREALNPTVQITDFYYTKNGLPMSEDKNWNAGRSLTDVIRIDSTYKYNLKSDYDVVAKHIEREPRFYANLAFDGSIWYMNSSVNEMSFEITGRADGNQTRLGANEFTITGYWPKKLVNYKYVIREGSSYDRRDYPWPEMRLPDLYLLYAEALCETDNFDQAIEYVDKIRLKAGLKGVKDTWTSELSLRAGKYNTKEGLREIIRHERTIELMFEGSRYWDVRRWKTLGTLNQMIQGWDVEQVLSSTYYRYLNVYNQGFILPRDYLSPIREYALIVNPNLVQNPYW